MSTEIYELISHFDLLSLEKLPRLLEWSPRRISELHEALWERIYEGQYWDLPPDGTINHFRFLASASLRGDICPGCRSEKIESLGRFAALYSDETIIPLPLDRPGKDSDIEDTRIELINTIESLVRLKALIRPGIIRPAVMSTRHCEHDAERTKQLIELAHLVADQLADDHIDQFEMLYEPSRGNGIPPKLFIRGPEDYIEHGEVVLRFSEPPKWVAKSWRSGPDGLMRVPASKVRRTGLVRALFQRIATDTTFQLAYGIPRRAKLLTDLPGDTEMLHGIDQDELKVQNQRAILFNALTHSLPFANELSLAQTVRMRKELRGAFEQYRFAITSIVQSHESDQNLTPRRARQIFGDELLPKILTLENQVTTERKRLCTKATATAGMISVIVGLGLFGIIPSSIALGLMGGAATMKMADLIGDAASPIPKVASNDLYFLLKLKQNVRNRKAS